MGRGDLVGEHMVQLHGHLLQPMGVDLVPADIDEAISVFVERRDWWERGLGVAVDRSLEDEVRAGVGRELHGLA